MTYRSALAVIAVVALAIVLYLTGVVAAFTDRGPLLDLTERPMPHTSDAGTPAVIYQEDE